MLPSMLLTRDELHRHGFSTGGAPAGDRGAGRSPVAARAGGGSGQRTYLPRRKVPVAVGGSKAHAPRHQRAVSPVHSPRGGGGGGFQPHLDSAHPHNASQFDEYHSLKPATAPPVKPPSFAGPHSPRLSVAQPRVARYTGRRRIVRPSGGAHPAYVAAAMATC